MILLTVVMLYEADGAYMKQHREGLRATAGSWFSSSSLGSGDLTPVDTVTVVRVTPFLDKLAHLPILAFVL